MQLIERTKLCHWIFISIFLVDPSHFAAIRRDGRSVTAVCALCKKSGLFFSRWIWGVDTTNSYICQQKINFKSSPNSGWLAGWLKKVASWLRHHRWYPVSRHWVDAKFCARAIRLDRNFVPFWRHLQSWCLDRSWWGETTTTLQGELPVSSNMGNPHENSFLLVKSSTNVFFFLVPYLMTGYWHWNRKGEEGSSR